jgi:O-antigen/teichoic acid export membrane protein
MLATKALVMVFSVSGAIFVARTLGPAGRGAIAVAFSFALLLVQFGGFGLSSANPFFAARDPRRIGTVVLNSLWATVAIGSVLFCVALAVKACFPAALRGLDWPEVIAMATVLPALLATQLLQSVFLAEGRMRVYNGVELAGSIVVFIGLAVGLGLLQIGVLGAIIVMGATNWAMVLAFLVLQRHQVSRFSGPDLELFWRMLKYGFRVYLTTFLAFMVGRINLILVGTYLGSAQAGIYVIGVAIGETLHLLPSVVPLNLFPRIARGAPFESSAVVFRTLCIVFGGLCLLTVPLVGPVINLLYGPRFAGAAGIYYWMLPGIFCYGMLNVLAYHFAGRGYPREAVLVWVPGLLANLAVVLVFLPGHEAKVAALAESIAYFIVLVLHMRLFAKESGGYRVLMPRPRELLAVVAVVIRDLRPRLAEG